MSPEDYAQEVGPISHPQETATDTTPRLESSMLVDKAVEQMRKTGEVAPETEDAKKAHHDSDELFVAENFTTLAISSDLRFYGKSSSAVFLVRALDMGKEYTKERPNAAHVDFLGRKRQEYWQICSWELDFIRKFESTSYMFPEHDLLQDLVDLYFKHINIFIPLLHKPTFIRQLEQGLHQREEGFGAVLLLVCANASRYSSDPRVRLDGEESWLSAGWKWFNQVQLVRKALLSPPSLFDLQIYYLLCQFLQGSSVTQASWTMIGICIRMAQDAGAHRKNMIGKMTIENELMKRAFWAMVYMDYSISAASGKPRGLQEEDYDLDLPTECDDEYWDHPDPDQAWRQPPGKPSTVSFFVSLLKLVKILALALRTIYSINKSRALLGLVGPQWEQRIVTELDSALNKWVDTVPEYRKRSGVSTDPTKDMVDIHKCMEALRSNETRWHVAGRAWDILYGLASLGELPLPQIGPATTNKRGRDEDSPISATTISEGSSPRVDNEHRNIAGSRRAMKASASAPGSTTQTTQQTVSPLPMYSDELGRLPVYGQHMTTQAEWTQLDDGAGFWFPPIDVEPLASNEFDAAAVPSMNDTQFSLDFPTLANAEFFDQLASMSWTTNEASQLSNPHYGDGDGINPPSGSHQPGQFNATSMWSEALPGFGFG
ncbi:Gypsy retrotransposon integrase-like protein 1 [Marasmius tenuissimus]|uniref:Gypsy retrotransposon integrase-like protein 1 n=1 Tax=Marasmius tenuissimus TaxID=585030 RepID=A0ABR3ACA6_9AGAR